MKGWPRLAREYAKKEAETTGLPLRDVVRSRPVQEYLRRVRE